MILMVQTVLETIAVCNTISFNPWTRLSAATFRFRISSFYYHPKTDSSDLPVSHIQIFAYITTTYP